MRSGCLQNARRSLPREKVGCLLVWLLLLAVGCTHTFELNSWLRLRRGEAITIIPHVFTRGDDRTWFETRIEGEWVPIADGYDWEIEDLSAERVLITLRAPGKRSVVLVEKGRRDVARRWSVRKGVMLVVEPERLEWLVWTPSFDRVRIQQYDYHGVEIGSSRDVSFPSRAGCYFSEMGPDVDGFPTIVDDCNREQVVLSDPPRVLPLAGAGAQR